MLEASISKRDRVNFNSQTGGSLEQKSDQLPNLNPSGSRGGRRIANNNMNASQTSGKAFVQGSIGNSISS